MKLKIAIIGLSITSSWGNGHATTYRALVKALSRRGHSVTFLERDVPWYRDHRDMVEADYCRIYLYRSLPELAARYANVVANADLVILGSYVPDGIAIGDWLTGRANGITAFYDIDTPVTLAGLEAGGIDYIASRLIPRFNIYLSFSGGPALDTIENLYGARAARALYCSADLDGVLPVQSQEKWSLGYLGTYSEDRQPSVEQMLLAPADRLPDHAFIVAGSKYPDTLGWPRNVQHISHLPPADHAEFYGSQRFTLNVTRSDMKRLGYSPSVRLFEAAVSGTPIISDAWPGIDTIFRQGSELLIANSPRDVVQILTQMSEDRRLAVAANARKRLLAEHTPLHRAAQLESCYREALSQRQSMMKGHRIHGSELEEAK